jgi:phosphotriesterase-related protein
VFRAAGRAQRATGVAVTTHTHDGAELALTQVDVLMDEGVPPDRIIIGHLGDWRTPDYFAEIAERGVFIQFDHIGMVELQLDEVRAGLIREMVERGYGDQILLSSDVCYKSHLRTFGGFGYGHLLTNFVPMLRAEGLSDAHIDAMLVDNPRNALVGPQVAAPVPSATMQGAR